jgi:hypothetical protein
MEQTPNYSWDIPDTPESFYAQLRLTLIDIDSTLFALDATYASTALDNLAAVAINTSLVLGTSDGGALGSPTKHWSDLFLAEGGVINWDNGDATLTQVGNLVTLAGAGFQVNGSVTFLTEGSFVAPPFNSFTQVANDPLIDLICNTHTNVNWAIQNSVDGSTDRLRFFTHNDNGSGIAERFSIRTNSGNVKIAGTAVRGTTEGTNHLDIFNGTAPAGTLTNGISIYSASGVPTVMDAAGNANGLGQSSSPTFAGLNVNGTIGASANLTIAPTGDIILNPTGNDILPTTNYDLNIGSLTNKFLTVHAAELWVTTLIAAETMATMGGRLVVPKGTTILSADLLAAGTTITVKHNNLASGDRIWLESNGKFEMMAVTSGAGGSAGFYTYTVTRNLDGSGANDWNAGDSIVNTGTTGDGFIEMYAYSGRFAGTGPTITGNVRNSATYNDISTHWAIGNLNGLYGYGSTTYGVGFGKYAAAVAHITIDATNGYRTFSGLSTVVHQIDNSGVITIGEVAAAKVNTIISAGALSMRLNTTQYFGIDTSANVTMGQVATDQGNAYWNNSNKRLEFRGSTAGTVVQAYVDTTGAITAGAGKIKLDSGGLKLVSAAVAPSGDDPTRINFYSDAGFTADFATIGTVIDASNTILSLSLSGATTNNKINLTSGATGVAGGSTLSLNALSSGNATAALTAQADTSNEVILTLNSNGLYAAFSGSGFTGLTIGANAAAGAMLDVRGDVLATTFIRSSGATSGIGYTTGAGGAVTQATSKGTGVTLNKVCGHITMHNAALAAAAKVSFVVTNSAVATTDGIVVWVDSGGTANAYRADVTAVGVGSFTITVENITAGSLSEAPMIGFAIIKAVTS